METSSQHYTNLMLMLRTAQLVHQCPSYCNLFIIDQAVGILWAFICLQAGLMYRHHVKCTAYSYDSCALLSGNRHSVSSQTFSHCSCNPCSRLSALIHSRPRLKLPGGCNASPPARETLTLMTRFALISVFCSTSWPFHVSRKCCKGIATVCHCPCLQENLHLAAADPWFEPSATCCSLVHW